MKYNSDEYTKIISALPKAYSVAASSIIDEALKSANASLQEYPTSSIRTILNDLQNSLKESSLSSIQTSSDTLRAYVNETYINATQSFQEAMLYSLNDAMRDYMNSINSCAKSISDSARKVSLNMESSISAFSRISDINAEILESMRTIPSTSDDFVILSETNNITPEKTRVRKIDTSNLLSIISLIVTLILWAIDSYSDQLDGASTSANTQQYIAEQQEENRLLREQNSILKDLLVSSDTSNSSQAEAIEEWKEFLQVMELYLSDVQDTPDSVPALPDNNQE